MLPKSVANSAGAVTFSPAPSRIVQDDPVVSYDYNLASGSTLTLGYRVDLSASSLDLASRLNQLAQDQDTAQTAYLAQSGQTAPQALDRLLVSPNSLSLTAGQSGRLTLSGLMSTGALAPATVLSTVNWSSDNRSVATVDPATGTVTAVGAGSATISAQSGTLTAVAAVTVTAAATTDGSTVALTPTTSSRAPSTSAAPRTSAVVPPSTSSAAPPPPPTSSSPTVVVDAESGAGCPGRADDNLEKLLGNQLRFVAAAPADPGLPAFTGYAGTVDTGSGPVAFSSIPADGLTVPCTALGQVTVFDYWAVNDVGSSAVAGPFTSTACPGPIVSVSPTATKTKKAGK